MNNASEWNAYLRLCNAQNNARADLAMATRAMEKANADLEESPVTQRIRERENKGAA